MGRIAINTMKVEDIKKSGAKGHEPIADPEKQAPKDYGKNKAPVKNHESGWL